ncbi:MAG: hypothetical protein MUF72_21925 [Elainella sp. Prado103]|jgi:WD40 repeat protein|nr:hypothetical protein [Elainella sp. Prado103]
MNSQEALAMVELAVKSTLKGRLSKLQKIVFIQAWEDRSYVEIANDSGYELGYVKQTGSQLWQLLSQALNEKVTKQNIQLILRQRIDPMVTEAVRNGSFDRSHGWMGSGAISGIPESISGAISGAISETPSATPCGTVANPVILAPHCDWGGATDAQIFFGRASELALLEQWVQNPSESNLRCRLIGLFGMGGIGKTSLSVRFAKQLIAAQLDSQSIPNASTLSRPSSLPSLLPSIASPLTHVIWRSLRNAPPLLDLLADLIRVLANQPIELADSLDGRLRQFLNYLRQTRCLILLDNAETIMQQGNCEGGYLAGYEGYGQLWHWIGDSDHQSIVVLTSREKPKEIAALEGKALAVRSLRLTGLSADVGQEICKCKGDFTGSEQEWQGLVDHYAGNPLALKMVAAVIQDLFNGDLSSFWECLQAGTSVFGDIQDLLSQQFQRLSSLEQQIMFWLAIVRQPIPLSQLRLQLFPVVPLAQFLEALTALERRYLLEKVVQPEKTQICFTLQPAVMEYVTERLLQQIEQEILHDHPLAPSFPATLMAYALIQAQAEDYVRETQVRLIVNPLADRLLKHYSLAQLTSQLSQLLQMLRHLSLGQMGYAGGNLLNLLCQLKIDLTGWDFSNLTVWNAYLKGICLQGVNFQAADLTRSVFTEVFSQVLTVAFSPDGKWLATGDVNHEIRLRQVSDGQQFWSSRVHQGWVWSVAFSPDGKWLASCANRTVTLWDVQTGEPVQTFAGYRDRVFSVAFSPDGQLLATGSEDHLVRIWHLRSGELLHQLEAHSDEVRSVAFSPNWFSGAVSTWQLASSSYDGTIRLWEISLEAAICTQVLSGHHDWIWSIGFSPDGSTLASGSSDGSLRLWQVDTGVCLRVLSHPQPVRAIAFSPDGRRIASGSTDQRVRLWDYQTGELLRVLAGHQSWISALAFSPESGLLASGSEDQSVILWDSQRGLCLKTLRGYSNGVWSVAFAAPTHWTLEHCSGQTAIENSENPAHWVASGSQDRLIRLWDRQTGAVLGTLSGHTNWIWSVAFSPIEPLLASGSEDQTIRLWDMRQRKLVQTLTGHKDAVLSVLFVDGQTLLSGSLDGTIKRWHRSTGSCTQTLKGHSGGVWCIALSPDGQQLASCSQDQTVKLWDVETGYCLQTLIGHESWIRCVAFSPDRQILVSGSADGVIKCWHTQTGQCMQTISAHQGAVLSVAFHPQGEQFVSSGTDAQIKLWNLRGECLTQVKGHDRWVRFLTYSPDGQTLASCSQDETIKLWQQLDSNLMPAEPQPMLRISRPYEGMIITQAIGLTNAQSAALRMLGAID